MTRKQHSRTFWTATIVLCVLHVDFFNHGVGSVLLFGWLPFDLAYHILWMVLAAVLVFYFTHSVWRSADEH